MKKLQEIINQLSAQSRRLFACDCAERELLKKQYQNVTQKLILQSINMAREFAMGRASKEEVQAKYKEAFPSFVYPAYFAAAPYDEKYTCYTTIPEDHLDEEQLWQIARAEAYLEAEKIEMETLRQQLCSLLRQRQERLSFALSVFSGDMETGFFEDLDPQIQQLVDEYFWDLI